MRAVVSFVFAGCLALLCQPVEAAPLPGAERGLRMATEVVEYECTTDDVTEKQNVEINVELTMPDDATTGRQMSIGWHATSYVTGSELRAPAAGLAGVKLYAYASLTGIANLTSATGVSEHLSTIAGGEIIPLPTAAVSLKTTASNAGTASVRPAAVNIGPSPTAPVIECEVRNADELTAYTLTVTRDGQSSTSPSPSATPSASATTSGSPKPTRTVTATVTAAVPDEDDEVAPAARDAIETPIGAAATGGGGEAGPDGRMYVLTGLAICLAAGAGLLLRRRLLAR
ncbi:hypothetical protein F5972_14660 [Microbispora cellulosiformans]|uniref:LPXTG cell wall anchor domain-containing protein n=1 Tax=Microbispora cellulosiformans TaxID=2614688 RepID=A0A5J5K188_9ACTN|nr:hypothetical protein [Microbispora cellulosiformans]KAA9378142.1 hypothetical protein F5972_14660 [Microbispora cellulosiformans]